MRISRPTSDSPPELPRPAPGVGPVAALGGAPLAVHDHLCAFYRGRAERDRLVLDYLQEGLRAGNTCLYVAAEGDRDAVRTALASDDPDVGRGVLEVREPSSTYLRSGTFSPDGMLELIDDWSREVFDRDDCSFARVAGDMGWAAPLVGERFVRSLAHYEARVTRWTRAYPQVAVCLYDLDLFGGDVIIAMIHSHPQVWLHGVVVDNPYFWGPYAADPL